MSDGKENKYQRTRIYKMTAGDLTYYGFTTIKYGLQSVICRMRKEHNFNETYKKYEGKAYRVHSVSYDLITRNDCKIELIENFPCSSRKEAEKRVRYFVDNNECVNRTKFRGQKKEIGDQGDIQDDDDLRYDVGTYI
jgi:hypothetical protein